MSPNNHLPKPGDIIQTGIIYANGDGSVVWCTHQIVLKVSEDGTIWYRPREAKVDKTPYRWRWPVEPIEVIKKDLRRWANPKAVREMIKNKKGPWGGVLMALQNNDSATGGDV